MPNVAPGNRSSTAWASTCAVEWRIVNRPSVAVARDDRHLVAVGERRRQVALLAVHDRDHGRLGQAGADVLGEARGSGAGGQRTRRTIGQPDRDLVGHGARRYRSPADRPGTGCEPR